MIPEGWSEELLGDLASLSAAPAKPSGGSRYVIVDMGSVAKDGSLLTHKNTDVAEDLLEVGDLVMPKDDIGGGQIIGKVIHIDVPNRYVLGDHVYRLRLHKCHPPYVRYAINSHQVNSSLRSKVVGSAQLGLGRRSVLEQPIPLPPLAEQQAIAQALSDADALVESLDALITKKRDMKQAAMQQLLTGRTRLPGFTDDWREERLGDICEIVMGQSPESRHYNRAGNGLPLIQGNADIANRRTIQRVWTTSAPKRAEAGDVLLTVRAPVGAVGRASAEVCLGRGVCAVKSNEVVSDFLFHALVAGEPRWSALEQGSTFTAANGRDVADFTVCVPEQHSEQQAIAEVLSDMDDEIDALVAQREKAELVKQGMMQELLSGRVRLV